MSDPAASERIGLFGGTFDPVHLGHLIVAEWIYDELNLNRIFFIPVYSHPFQKRATISPPEMRLQMMQMAIEDFPQFEISTVELDRKDVSYTIDTLRYFNKHYPDAELFYLIGTDNLMEFSDWKEPEAILSLTNLVVFNRKISKFEETSPPQKIIYIDSPTIEISSTQIRNRIRTNRPCRSFLAPKVYKFICENKLYINQ